MWFKIIIVQSRYQINLGYIARISKNFGVAKLFLVKPRTKIGGRAIMFAKHARDLLTNAKIYKDLDSAIADCDVVVGTTGIWRKARVSFKRIYLIDETVRRLSKLKGDKTASSYLNVPTPIAAEGNWPQTLGDDSQPKFAGSAQPKYWRGFQYRSAVGLEIHNAPKAIASDQR